jgi:hydrogenase maturation protease
VTEPRASILLGLGQDAAGDDGVGLAVARVLRERGLDARTSTDASVVVGLLDEGARVVIVDAVVGGGVPGEVIEIAPAALGGEVAPVSSHGVSLRAALDLAAVLSGEEALSRVRIVGVVIEPPTALAHGLTPEVARAVSIAADRAARIAAESADAVVGSGA